MKNSIFTILQKLGRSFMLPIAVLPAAGILLGIGSSFTNLTTLENLGLLNVMGEGTILYSLFTIMAGVGSAIFDNLPLIFAIGIAIGLADKQKETAALAAASAYLVMNITINKVLIITGVVDVGGNILGSIADGAIANVLGMTTLQIGCFGGIVVGIGVSILHNKFYNISLPNYLAFFGGNRFVPIVSIFTYIFVGIILSFIWPGVQNGILALGQIVAKSGLIGVFLYDFIRRLLIPFGLHHVFYMPFWQTALGGRLEVAGTTYVGAQNILFAQLADPATKHISTSASMYFSGEYPIMIFALPLVCYVIYKNAKEENKEATKSLMISAALTSLITGITEPIEFPILFASPLLYVVHAFLSGISNVILYLCNFAVGCTFSDGLIDLILLGILPGNSKTGWLVIIPVGILLGVVYFFIFDFAIKKYDLKTPGREDGREEVKVNALRDDASDLIASGLGGKENIVNVGCCATRLRVIVKDNRVISESDLRNTGALAVMVNDNSVQVIYGPGVNLVKSKLEDYLSNDNKTVLLRSPIVGKYIKLEDVPDEAFASGSLGAGVAVDPEKEYVYAPSDGRVAFIYPTKHAIGFVCKNGISILIHLGIDTVNLEGKGFESLVNEGDEVKLGTPMMKLDLQFLRKNAKSMISPIIITELKGDEEIEIIADEHIDYNEAIMRIKR